MPQRAKARSRPKRKLPNTLQSHVLPRSGLKPQSQTALQRFQGCCTWDPMSSSRRDPKERRPQRKPTRAHLPGTAQNSRPIEVPGNATGKANIHIEGCRVIAVTGFPGAENRGEFQVFCSNSVKSIQLNWPGSAGAYLEGADSAGTGGQLLTDPDRWGSGSCRRARGPADSLRRKLASALPAAGEA